MKKNDLARSEVTSNLSQEIVREHNCVTRFSPGNERKTTEGDCHGEQDPHPLPLVPASSILGTHIFGTHIPGTRILHPPAPLVQTLVPTSSVPDTCILLTQPWYPHPPSLVHVSFFPASSTLGTHILGTYVLHPWYPYPW